MENDPAILRGFQFKPHGLINGASAVNQTVAAGATFDLFIKPGPRPSLPGSDVNLGGIFIGCADITAGAAATSATLQINQSGAGTISPFIYIFAGQAFTMDLAAGERKVIPLIQMIGTLNDGTTDAPIPPIADSPATLVLQVIAGAGGSLTINYMAGGLICVPITLNPTATEGPWQ